ncbi:unnamed protein product [Periconia digitata]|uniref:Uncharacterized protein n=1 Tax=Periconia digitata TaxID=1303443 RepID=A0A9W4XKW4_9PLEO|nr:unnamed protein product [Periconia digitata]
MVNLLRTTMALMAVGVTLATQSISLSNFTPRIENLPITCQNAYESSIQGCTKDDFGGSCSSSCIQGLNRITTVVVANCKSVNVPGNSIIGVFMAGGGVQALCPNVQATTAPSSSATPPPQTSTIPAPPPPTTSSSSQADETPESSTTPSPESTDASSSDPSTTSTSSTASSSTDVATSSSSSDPPQLSTATGSPPPLPSQTESSQRASQNPGGGSPFDIGASAPATQLQPRKITLFAMLGLVLVLAT